MMIKNIRSSNQNASTWLRSLLIAVLLLSFAGPMQADYLDRDEVQVFIDELVEAENVDREWLEQMFLDAEYSQSVIDAISRPAEKTLAWAEYQKIFLTQSRLESGIEFWRENTFVLDEAEAEFGVPPEIVLAIIGVETLYGRYTGGYRVIDSLSTLAFDYPPRASFFRLIRLITMAMDLPIFGRIPPMQYGALLTIFRATVGVEIKQFLLL
jgi:membrane-bound lytic murein transglycosylase B